MCGATINGSEQHGALSSKYQRMPNLDGMIRNVRCNKSQSSPAPVGPCASSGCGATLAFAPHSLRIVTAAATSPASTSRSAFSTYRDLCSALRGLQESKPCLPCALSIARATSKSTWTVRQLVTSRSGKFAPVTHGAELLSSSGICSGVLCALDDRKLQSLHMRRV